MKDLEFTDSFDVQDIVIPKILTGKNIAFTSRTGSGKTLTYLLGAISRLNTKQGLQMLVIVPTRELCIQIGREISKFCDPLGINVGVLYGGREIARDSKIVNRKNQIIIGTSGRLIQHINNKNVRVGDVKILVYDESDHLFEDEFYKDSDYIKDRVGKNAQIILSSATLTDNVTKFINNKIPNCEIINVGLNVPKNIVQEKLFCEEDEKYDIILKLLKKNSKIAIFCNSKNDAKNLFDYLDSKINVKLISGNTKQDERLEILRLFKNGQLKIIITTDVVARGLHIEKIDIIINYNVPTRHERYVHRIGRTGRKDIKGYAISLISPEEEDLFHNIEFEFELKVKKIEKI